MRARGRTLSVGGGAWVTVSGGHYTSEGPPGQIEFAAMDVMGSAVLFARGATVVGRSRAIERGGAGRLFIDGGSFDPPLPSR
jgi:hypothetical protein